MECTDYVLNPHDTKLLQGFRHAFHLHRRSCRTVNAFASGCIRKSYSCCFINRSALSFQHKNVPIWRCTIFEDFSPLLERAERRCTIYVPLEKQKRGEGFLPLLPKSLDLFVLASFVSFASPQAAKLIHDAARPLRSKPTSLGFASVADYLKYLSSNPFSAFPCLASSFAISWTVS